MQQTTINIGDRLELLRRLESAEQWEAAEALCISLLELYPRHPDLLMEAARMALLRSSPSVAEQLLYRTLAIDPLNTSAYLALGMSRYQQNDFEDAEIYFRKALFVAPRHGEASRHLGTLLNEQGRFHEALPLLTEAHLSLPGSIEATLSLADSLLGVGESEGAYHLYQQVIEQNPDQAEARISMGAVCEALDRLDEALTHLFRAGELAPENPKVYLNLGGVFQRMLKLDEALTYYFRALELRPGYPTARWNICQIYLLQGRYRDGFSDFDSRFDSANPVRLRKTSLPLWNGTPAGGTRILVLTEQGYGDTIQFVRYIPLLARAGVKVALENHLTALNPLLLSLDGLERIFDSGSGETAAEYSLPLLSLPQLFATSNTSIPCHVPYLAPSREKTAEWRARVADDKNLKVGICWAGRKRPDHRRSIPSYLLKMLNSLDQISWYSLQVDESSEKVSGGQPEIDGIIDLTGHIRNFEDSAALIVNLDLVVTIDSAVAHLAGALAAQTWLLLPFAPDWRWQLDCNNNPWYPTIRVFRQHRPGDWADVLEHVILQLRATAGRNR